jgi:hypothetical protein
MIPIRVQNPPCPRTSVTYVPGLYTLWKRGNFNQRALITPPFSKGGQGIFALPDRIILNLNWYSLIVYTTASAAGRLRHLIIRSDFFTRQGIALGTQQPNSSVSGKETEYLPCAFGFSDEHAVKWPNQVLPDGNVPCRQWLFANPAHGMRRPYLLSRNT